MFLKKMFLAVCISVLSIGATYSDNFTPSNIDGCENSNAFTWMSLSPGTTWTTIVDLSQCTSSDLGLFLYYGYLAGKTSSAVLRDTDGVVLTINDLTSGAFLSSSGTKGSIYLAFPVYQPTKVILTAQNTGQKVLRVRFTFKKVA